LGQTGGSVPTSFDDALGKGTSFVFAKCITTEHCKFHIFTALAKLKNQHKIKKFISGLDDPCSVHPTCHECIIAPENCGWCSVPVLYNNTIIGKNCAGVNTTISPRLNCTGTFSTVDCPSTSTAASTASTAASTGHTTGSPSEDKYLCDPITSTCKKSSNGTQPQTVCAAQCVLTPIVPPDLQNKYFRGLQIDTEYVQGEWRLHFGTTDATIVDPSGKASKATITATAQYLSLTFTSGIKIQALWQLQTGPSNLFLTWAWGLSDGAAPKNFDESMTTSGEKEFWFVACLPGASTGVCDFSQ